MDFPFRSLRLPVGARIIKTGVAVFIVLVVSHWINLEYSTFAAVAAILAIQPSVSKARQAFGQQLLANVIGGLVGAALGAWLGSGAPVMALAVVLVLWLCTRLHLLETASTAVVAVLFIMDRPEHDYLLYTAARLGAIVGGMLVGYLVNRLLYPPNFTASIQAELRTAAHDGVESFGRHLLSSLASPEHYRKEQIKSEAAQIRERLERATNLLDWYRESGGATHQTLVLAKAVNSMYVFVERFMDIHKMVLLQGGLRPGRELSVVAGALKAALHYKQVAVTAALEGSRPDPDAALGFTAALSELEQLTTTLIGRPETRDRGLALHSVMTNIRHMGWRMDSLSRLLTESST